MTDQKLREAFQAHSANNTPATREHCPSADALHALAASTAIGDDHRQVAQLEHVLSCGACRPEFELLRAAHTAALEDDDAANGSKSRSLFTLRRVALAATVLLAAGIAGETFMRSEDPIVRAGSDVSDVVLVSPAANSSIKAGDATASSGFVWRAVTGASSYRIEILDTTGVVLVEATSADTVMRLSSADSARVFSQPAFDWFVSALRSDGNERRSPLARVRNEAISPR